MCGLMMPCLVPLFMPRASVRSTAARRRLAWALLSKNILSSDLLRLSKRQRLQELLLALKTRLARPSPQPLNFGYPAPPAPLSAARPYGTLTALTHTLSN